MIYAFYGMGKTTLADKMPDQFADVDECYTEQKTFAEQVAENECKVILTNKLVKDVTLAFLPKNMNVAFERLHKRGVDSSFIDELKKQQSHFLEYFTDCPIIFLGDNEYVSNYADYIILMEKGL